MNSINIVGNLTRDPEMRTTNSGVSVCSFTVAVKRPHSSEATDFLPCVVWRQGADYLGRYAHKGSKVGVSGYLSSRSYEDKDGQRRTVYEINAETVELCESRSASQGQNYSTQAAKPQQAAAASIFEAEMGDDLIEIGNDELPF